MSEIPLHPYDPDEERFSHGRPQDPPIDAAYIQHLRDQAERSSDGVWVNPDVLEHLVAVFEAAGAWCDAAARPDCTLEDGDLEDAVNRARGVR